MNLLQKKFSEIFGGKEEWIVRAPGRVNLIGEHTDYNGGFVLPMAIDRAVWIALRSRKDKQVFVYSMEYKENRSFSLDILEKQNQEEKKKSEWIDYIQGTAWALQKEGYNLSGWEGAVCSDVPIGAGLSSSAALELATARAFATIGNIPWNPSQMAYICQKAENLWVHVSCGIMDQMISACGEKDHALLIDCRSLETKLCPTPKGTSIIIMDTATRRGLVESAYNLRREQCETASRLLGIQQLRDISWEDFPKKSTVLSDILQRRSRHVVSENFRTLQAQLAMEKQDTISLGKYMNESHESLKNDFEVSNDALNAMVECARNHPACFGARMTGAGFGGCAVALVRQEMAQDFSTFVSEQYKARTTLNPTLYISQATKGAEIWNVE